MHIKTISLAFACTALIVPLWVNAAAIRLASDMTSGAEVPPATAPGASGNAAMVLDDVSGKFSWIIVYEGLTGPATAAHFHSAAVGEAGPIQLDLDSAPGVVFSGIGETTGFFSGNAVLSALQIDDVVMNLWYINIHTAANPPGEIRGQVYPGTFEPNPVPLPAAIWMFVPALLGILVFARKR